MSLDWKRLNTLDRTIAIGAGIAFIAAFLPWWGVGPYSADGWAAGFSAWAGSLLLTAAGALLVLLRSGFRMPSTRIGPAVAVAGLSGIGLLLVIIRWASLPRYHGLGVGPKFGIYVALLAGLAEVGAAVMEMRASGESMPWAQAQQGATPESPLSPEPDPGPGPDAPALPEE